MGFAAVHWLWGLLAIPALAGLAVWRQRRTSADLARLGDPWLVGRLAASLDPRRRWTCTGLRGLALMLLVLALARLQYGQDRVQVEARGSEILVLLDLSTSMLAEDITPNRLEKAKYEVARLLDGLNGDRIGLVAFAGSAFLSCPLTLDYAAAKLFLSGLDVNSIGRQGTDIAEAIQVGLRAFGEPTGAARMMLVLTDGEDHGGKAADAARAAAAAGVRVHAVGIGGREGHPIPLRGRSGGVQYKRDLAGTIVTTRLDPETLEAVAKAGAGLFFHADSGQVFDLDTIFAEIEKMEKAEFKQDITVSRIDRYRWFLLPALLLVAGEMWISDRRKRLPEWKGRFAA